MIDEISAEATVTRLKERRGEVLARRSAITGELGKPSLLALAGADKAARKTVDSLLRENQLLGDELIALDAAIDEGGREVEAARMAAAREQRRDDGRRALDEVARFRLAGRALADAVDALKTAILALDVSNRRVSGCNVRGPSSELMRVGLDRAIKYALVGTSLGVPMRPGDRVELPGLLEGWAQRVESQAQAMIDGQTGTVVLNHETPPSELEALSKALGGDDDINGRLIA